MARGLILIIDTGHPGAVAAAGLPVPEGLEAQVYSDPDAAFAALQQVESPRRAPAAVVIRGAPKGALAAARRVYRLDPQVQMIFIADEPTAAELRQRMGLAPRIGTYWTIAAAGADELPRLLVEATRSTHQRRQLRTTLDRVSLQTAPPPPTDGPDYRRLVVSDRYLAAILIHAHDAILSVDSRGKILTANLATTRLTGYAEHELLSRSLPMLTLEQEAGDVEEMLDAVREGEPEVRRELHIQHRMGGEVDVDMMLAPVRDEIGRLLGISAIIRDISERRRAEEAIREQQEWLRVTLTSIGDAVIATDTEGRVTFLNPVAAKLTRWSQQDAAGRPLEEVFVIVNEQTRQPVEHPVRKVIRDGVIVGLANHTLLIARDGTERPIDDSAAPIRDSTGKFLGVVLVFHDISERRQIERKLQERTERLAESDRRKDEFLALLGHELRNPLAPLRNGLDVLAFQQEHDPELTREIHTLMGRQVDQLVHLVDDLLDVSRISRGVLQLRRQRVELGTIVTRAVETTRSVIAERQHELTTTLPGEPVWLDADPVRLEQIFCNLLTNASRYTEPGGQIRIAADREDQWATVRVTDTGIGIRPEMLSRIFELFTQGDRITGSVHEGLGLGLTLVKSLTGLHEGSIDATSAGLGEGSEFIVRLPALPEPSPMHLRSPAVPPTDGPPLRVLVIDENRDAADSLAMLLRVAGHDVRVTCDGHAGLQLAASYLPDLVLVDVGLHADLDGYHVAKQLRQQPEIGRPMLVALTGLAQESDRRRTRQAGFDAHLVKPANTEAVHALLTQAARQRSLGRRH